MLANRRGGFVEAKSHLPLTAFALPVTEGTHIVGMNLYF